MADTKALFGPMPLRSMAADLSGLTLRTLLCVASHDRLSLAVGKGQGCRASNERMAQLVGCSYARMCSTLSELVELGYLQREKLGRHTVYRVIYSDADRLLFSNVLGRAIGSRSASRLARTGCHASPESGGNLPETPPQYISLNEGIDSDESGKESSVETARFAARQLSRKGWLSENDGAQLAMFERAYRAAPEAINDEQLTEARDWLQRLTETLDPDDPNYQRAQRLYFDADAALWERDPDTGELAA